ncbi:class I SAM-dependent methyltransferase [Candidatus Pacearchaeota archaeon]|nr:class I SAM-dependent methyltransferase [Candidatus Pacearchaeota archaeon]
MQNKEKTGEIFPKDIILKCERMIAYDSNDYLYPKGSKHDNSTNWLFNFKLYRLFYPKYSGQITGNLKILDLGCAGGGFVRACINDGCFAVGLEGSDYSKKMHRAEWPIIPDSLFTCDITKDFSITKKKPKQIIKFHVITAWEVLEHLEENQIGSLIENIKKHLLEEGLFIASVANYSDMVSDIEFHRTQKPKKWWVKKFAEHGMYNLENFYPYFNGQYIRGPEESEKSFHIIMSLNPKKAPKPIKLSLKEKIVDIWKDSKIQRFLLK